MREQYTKILKPKMDADSFKKLEVLNNDKLHAFVADAVELGRPDSVKVCSDEKGDVEYIRRRAVETGEETALATEGHTVHFDGYFDQGRDKQNTKYLVGADIQLGKSLNQVDRETGLAEVRGLLEGAMAGREAYVRFFCMGPTDSPFSISCVQVTDSAYVCHSEDLLYRRGYEQFKALGQRGEFFKVIHSSGRVGQDKTSIDVDKRRIYIDIAEDLVYSVNTQYGGNTIGFKKLSLRLAIRKADREGWLAEHMFLMGVRGPSERVTYFAGAYPSGCGKTSTAMLPGEMIVGDDLAFFRVIDAEARAVNVESGIFGIIRDVNGDGDPLIFDVLTSPGEVIFSNILTSDGTPYWEGMGRDLPDAGRNHCGQWELGKVDDAGKQIPPSHWNARYTVAMEKLANLDERLDDPQGVPIGGIIYGGRDSDTAVPVTESFDWAHGIITAGASLESETTATTLGAEGVRAFDLMSILQFLAIPIGKYIRNNLNFAKTLANPPLVFATNYYLKDENGEYLNGMLDKAVWIKWMELRVHGDLDAIEGPTGLIPKYEDLKRLFAQVRGEQYAEADYVKQFTIRVGENLAKVDRITKIYKDISDTPQILFDTLAQQRDRLLKLQAAKGDYVSPLDL